MKVTADDDHHVGFLRRSLLSSTAPRDQTKDLVGKDQDKEDEKSGYGETSGPRFCLTEEGAPILAQIAGAGIAGPTMPDCLQQEVQAFRFFFIFRTQHAVARRVQLPGFIGSQQLSHPPL